jgi:hypothetical protein
MYDPFAPGDYVVIKEPKYSEAVRFEYLVALGVVAGLFEMNAAVDFDHEVVAQTQKVDDETEERLLAAKVKVRTTVAFESIPKQVFRFGLA